ncbi:hypothetical protein IFR05_014843 [Cadophora sp. M221]|nr:hypothetical protein IFR05_014843 [Cadophora sp. M221]
MVIDKLHELVAGDNWSVDDCSSLRNFIHSGSGNQWPAARELLVDLLVGTKDQEKFDKYISLTRTYGIVKEIAQALKNYPLEGLERALRPASYCHVPDPAAKK